MKCWLPSLLMVGLLLLTACGGRKGMDPTVQQEQSAPQEPELPATAPITLEPLPPLSSISASEAGWPGDGNVAARLDRLENLDNEPVQAKVRATLQLALADADPKVREKAISQMHLLPNSQAAPLLQHLVRIEPVANVRNGALETVGEWKGPEAIPVLATALHGPSMDGKLIASSQLTLRGDKPSLETLLPALKDPDLEFREKVNDQLEFLIDKRFRDYSEAAAWWQNHAKEFDGKLFREQP